jgi:2-polyprenyl-3-methyl-5-hydroxy-6-metoxy-1,4-benzoquinol methylase
MCWGKLIEMAFHDHSSSTKCRYCNLKIFKPLKSWQNKKNQLSIIWCPRCHFGWLNPYPSDSQLKNLYEKQEVYFEDFVDETQGGFELRIKRINEIKPEKGKLIDIGSGLGHFLYHAQNTGWEIDGIEPRIKAADYCYKKFNIKVQNNYFEDFRNERNTKYDLITLWDVLEHVNNPFQHIERSIQLLKKDGLLIFSIPNSSGINAKIFRGNWRYTMSPHINYFTFKFISDYLKKEGLQIIRADHTIKIQSIVEGINNILPFNYDSKALFRKGYIKPGQRKRGVKSFLREIALKQTKLQCP